MGDTLWSGQQNSRLYKQSGFTSSPAAPSIDVGATDFNPLGITSDGIDTYWAGSNTEHIFHLSGFTDTYVEPGVDLSALGGTTLTGITYDGDGNFVVSFSNKIVKLDGFSDTVLGELALGGAGVSFDGVDYLYADNNPGADDVYKLEGFSTIVRESVAPAGDELDDVSWDGNHLMVADNSNDLLIRYYGFSSDEAGDLDISLIDNDPGGLEHDSTVERFGVPPPGAGTYISGEGGDNLYHLVGFSPEINATVDVSASTNAPKDLTQDGSGDWYIVDGQSDDLIKLDGFSSSELSSFSVSGQDTNPLGCTWDGTDMIWCGAQTDRIRKQDGFSSSELSTIDVSAIDGTPIGVCASGGDILLAGAANNKLYRLDGFSDTIKAETSFIPGTGVEGISFNGSDPIFIGEGTDLMRIQSGFSDTSITTVGLSSVETLPTGIEHGDFIERLAAPAETSADGTFTVDGSAAPSTAAVGSFSFSGSAAPTTAAAGTFTFNGLAASDTVALGSFSVSGTADFAIIAAGTLTFTGLGSEPIVALGSFVFTGTANTVGPTRTGELRGLHRAWNDPNYRIWYRSFFPPVQPDLGNIVALPTTMPYEHQVAQTAIRHYWSMSYFNGVIDSGFLPLGPRGETYIVLDLTGGAGSPAAATPPRGPDEWRLEQRAGGVVRIHGVYAEFSDNRADEWAIAYTVDAGDPPADTPDVVVTMPVGGVVFLQYDLPAQSHGALVKVRLQTRRSGGTPEYSRNSVVKQITIDAQGPASAAGGHLWVGRAPDEL